MSNAYELTNSLYWVADRCLGSDFPPTSHALTEPDGLLAIGGDLSSERLLGAYRRGIFPWYSADQPILWWSPDPRSVILPGTVHVSRRLRRTLRQAHFEITLDRAFDAVVAGCAAPRDDAGGTWITAAMRRAYAALHRTGHAHSIECWRAGELVGGLYGVALGCTFFGESKFSRERDASKVALVTLAASLEAWGYGLFDCQVHNAHLESLGARCMPRVEFERRLAALVDRAPAAHAWQTAVTVT